MSADTGRTSVIFPDGQESSGKASPDGFSASVSADSSAGHVDVTMHTQESNPLIFGSPPISYTLNLVIDPNNNTVQAAFDHTMFPSFQVFLDGVPAFNYQEQGGAWNLCHFQTDTFSTQERTAAYVVPPATPQYGTGYVYGTPYTELWVVAYPSWPATSILTYPGQLPITASSFPGNPNALISDVPVTVGWQSVGVVTGSVLSTRISGSMRLLQIGADQFFYGLGPNFPNDQTTRYLFQELRAYYALWMADVRGIESCRRSFLPYSMTAPGWSLTASLVLRQRKACPLLDCLKEAFRRRGLPEKLQPPPPTPAQLQDVRQQAKATFARLRQELGKTPNT